MQELTVPLDDAALDLIEHALNTAVDFDEDGNRTLVGGEFTLPKLLDFWSGFDLERSIHIGYAGDVPVYENLDAVISEHDLVRALVLEIRRLRDQQ